MRRHSIGTERAPPAPICAGSDASPVTLQMLPSHALTIAVSPPSVKSKPVRRIRQNQGLLVGRFSTSTAKGPSSAPTSASLCRTWDQRAGPPMVFGARSRAGTSMTTASAKAWAAGWSSALPNHRVNLRAAPAGMCKRRSPSWVDQRNPCTSPSTPATETLVTGEASRALPAAWTPACRSPPVRSSARPFATELRLQRAAGCCAERSWSSVAPSAELKNRTSPMLPSNALGLGKFEAV